MREGRGTFLAPVYLITCIGPGVENIKHSDIRSDIAHTFGVC